MPSSSVPKVDIERAEQVWAEYCETHDMSELQDKAAAIEPQSGRVWIGESALNLRDQMRADGVDAPVYLIRVGSDHYLRKGGRR
jgi:hypothetical protein